MRVPRWTRAAGLVGAALLFSCSWGAPRRSLPPPRNSSPRQQPADNKPAEFVGSATCQACHEDIFNAFQKSPHQVVETDKKRGWETKACESCHGPGSKHAESVSRRGYQQPAKLKPGETDRICLTCHLNQSTHTGRLNSSHAKNQVSCAACHSIHKNGPHGLVARKPAEINKQCAACHTDVWASFQRPYKHRLPEGAMSCVDCHNPHGSVLPALHPDHARQRAGLRRSATATRADPFPSSTLRCAWKAARPAMSRTARPTRAC